MMNCFNPPPLPLPFVMYSQKAAKQALDALQRDLTAQQQAAAAEQRQGDGMDELATQVQSFQVSTCTSAILG